MQILRVIYTKAQAYVRELQLDFDEEVRLQQANMASSALDMVSNLTGAVLGTR